MRQSCLHNHPLEALLKAQSLETAKKIMETLCRYDIKLLDCFNESYPTAVRMQLTSPAVLYYRGNLKNNYGVAIVGSRRCTDYGKP